MSDPNKPGIETASIITLSTAHLHPATRHTIEIEDGDLLEGPSVAVRDEGFLVNSHIGSGDALAQDLQEGLYPALVDRMPDLVLIRALARGMQAAWINFDRDGQEYPDILPVYDHQGAVTAPTGEGWREALCDARPVAGGATLIVPSREVLEMIEAGQTPTVYSNTPEM